MSDSVNAFPASSAAHTSGVLAIIVGGFIAGVLDLFYAILVYSPAKPILIAQTIASG